MTTLRLTNSMTGKKENFAPIDPQNVRMYVCGPTVYDRAHLGNARPVVVFDVLYRLLRHIYGAEHVTYVRNFTDVDDKINAKAAETGRAIRDITDETIGWYHADMDALGALRPNHEPRATEYIPQMIAMISDLITRGHAYAAEGHVLFRVRSYPAYGALSGRTVDDMIAGARVEVAPFKEDPMDFVLWKPSEAGIPGWESPWGYGRPGWHIECSAMAKALLGERFDIHGGGLDLQFPHHENEIAQSCCAHGHANDPDPAFANVWLHNEMLLVEGKKMSKSLGNFFTVLDLLFGDGIPGEVIRYVLLSTHYRKPMDWTKAKAEAAEQALRKWHYICLGVKPSKSVPQLFIDALADDLNTSGAIAILHQFAKEGNASDLLVCANMLGLLVQETSGWFDPDEHSKVEADERILEVTNARIAARRAGRFDLSDLLRELLWQAGVAVFDHKLTSGAFREPNALRRYAHSQAFKAWSVGDVASAERMIKLLQLSGFSVHIDEDGPSAVSGFDEALFESHFDRGLEQAVIKSRKVLAELERDQ